LGKPFGWLSSKMKAVYLKALSLTALLIVVISLVPIGRTEGGTKDTEISFLLAKHQDSFTTYELNVSIPFSLYQYYTQQNHFLFSSQDFSRFITPYSMKPVADRLWQIYNNTEDFTNGVLMIAHQITYQEIEQSKYPVETLVDGKGDCDLFVYIAASILEAGGIPVVILYYKEKLHMELAVDIGYQPVDAVGGVYSVTYHNATYYIAECTGGSWRSGWRVGECPSDYQNATSQVIGPENMETSSIGQVTASLRELDPSTLALHMSSLAILQNDQVTLTGQIFPSVTNENVTLKGRSNGGSWFLIGSAETNADGRFSYNWTIQTPGSMEVQASWVGNNKLNGASSNVVSVWILPFYLIVLVSTACAMAAVLAMVFVKVKRSKRTTLPVSAPDSI
jgi:hypothetical protein